MTCNQDEGNWRPMVVTDLPPELLLMILDLLPPVEAVCLSLCNHKLFGLTGEKERAAFKLRSKEVCFEALKPNRDPLVWNEDREVFLTRVSRDQPRYFFCYTCAYLHPWEKIQPPGPAFQPNPLLRCQANGPDTLYDIAEAHIFASYYRLKYCHVQLAMRRFYCGPEYGILPKSLNYTDVQLWPDQPFTTLLSVEARICADTPSLCMRIQSLTSVRRSAADLLLAKNPWLVVCAHVYMTKPGRELRKLVEDLMDTYHRGRDTPDTHLHRCSKCCTDYKLALRAYDGNKLALVITRWLNFGSGLSVNDSLWTTRYGALRRIMPGTWGRIGDTRVRFENATGGGSDEGLLRRNLSYLSGNRFKVDMDKMSELMWFLQAETRVPRLSLFKPLANWTRALYNFCRPNHSGQPSSP